MKKKVLLSGISLLLTAVLFASCGKTEEASLTVTGSESVSEFTFADVQIADTTWQEQVYTSETAAGTTVKNPINSPASAKNTTTQKSQTTQSGLRMGAYYSGDAGSPYIVLNGDGTCYYYECYYEYAMAHNGKYTFDGKILKVTYDVNGETWTGTWELKNGNLVYAQHDTAVNEYGQSYSTTGAVTVYGTEFKYSTAMPDLIKDGFFGDKYDSDAEKVAQIVIDNESLWVDNIYSGNSNGVAFFDINGDGNLEFLVTSMGGSGGYSGTNYYSVDIKNKTMKEIPLEDESWMFEAGDVDWLVNNTINMYKNNGNGEYLMMGTNIFTDRYGTSYYYFTHQYKNGTIKQKALVSDGEKYIVPNDDRTSAWHKYSGETMSDISKEEFNSMLKEPYEGFRKVNVNYKVMEIDTGTDFWGYTGEIMKESLIESYNSFSLE